jgi:hypothetical protein
MAREKGVDFPKDGESSDARIQDADHERELGVGGGSLKHEVFGEEGAEGAER